MFTGVVLESELIVRRLIGLEVSGEYRGEETVSTLFIGETIANQNCGKKIACNGLVFLRFDFLMCDGIVSNQELLDR